MFMSFRRAFGRPLVCLLLLMTAAAFPAQADVTFCDDFVTRDGAKLKCGGDDFRFVGVNIRELAYIDQVPLPEDNENDFPGEPTQQLRAAAEMGATVVRIWISKHDAGSALAVSRLQQLIDIVENENLDIMFLVTLTDFLRGNLYYVQGDDDFYPEDKGHQEAGWYYLPDFPDTTSGYRQNYLDFVREVVGPLAGEKRILAWELGNELKVEYYQAEEAMLRFVYDVGSVIKDELAASQLLTTGFISAADATYNQVVDEGAFIHLLNSFHKTWNHPDRGSLTSPIDFGSLHIYDHAWNDQHMRWEYEWYESAGVPFVVGEHSYRGASTYREGCTEFPSGTWDDLVTGSIYGDRSQAIRLTAARLFDEYGAEGVMQWGFSANDGELYGGINGTEDDCLGMGHIFHHDWNNLHAAWSCRASILSSSIVDQADLQVWNIEANIAADGLTTFSVTVKNGGEAATEGWTRVGVYVGDVGTDPVAEGGFVTFGFHQEPIGPNEVVVIETEEWLSDRVGQTTVAAVVNDTGDVDNEEERTCNNGYYTTHDLVAAEASIDLCLSVDTTGSMGPYIAAAKNSSTQVVNALYEAAPSSRVAVTDFRDYPFSPWGRPGDYSFRIRNDFTDNQTDIVQGIQGLNLGNGGDFPESVFAGLIGCIYGRPAPHYAGPSLSPWRGDVAKAIILIGDAPPHDPEPYSAYDLAGVIADANSGGISALNAAVTPEKAAVCDDDYDGIRIFAIRTGSSSSAAAYFQALADGTCGQYFAASQPDDVVTAILEIIDVLGNSNEPPVVDGAVPTVTELWPPNHKWNEIGILGISDPEGQEVTVEVTAITQDEPVAGPGKHHPDGDGVGTASAQLRAERDGGGDGRVYTVSFTATDPSGASADGSVTVCVPHDQGGGCVDSGQAYDSTVE